jgi:pimeloyl-ACP methyl ester carboxylesterase
MNPVYYEEHGKGPVLVLLHGFCETHEIWTDVVHELSFNYYRVIAPDLPGFGKSPILTDRFTIKQVGQAIAALLTTLKVDQCILIGHSLGGYVALAMAEERPSLTVGLCLFHSTASADSLEKKINRNRVVDFVKKNGAGPYIETFIPGLFAQKEHPGIKKAYKIASETSEKTLLAYTEAMSERPDMIGFIKKYAHPILFVAGEKDSIIPLSDLTEQVAVSINGRLMVMSEVGHMGMFEDTRLTIEILKDFAGRSFQLATS